MAETKKTYEQYCTHLKRNVFFEETVTAEGKTVIKCTEKRCIEKNKICKNKLRKIS